jgi:hypothetical protein
MKETNNQCVEIALFKFDSKQSVTQQQASIKLMDANSMKEPTLGPILSTIDMSSFKVGYYVVFQ